MVFKYLLFTLTRSFSLLILILVSTGYSLCQPTNLVFKIPQLKDSSSISIDGKIDKKEWENAATFKLQPSVGSINENFQSTEVKLAWTTTHLYLAYNVDDSYILAKAINRDDQVYYDDCVEVFLSPFFTNDTIYFGWEMNSNAVFYDFIFFPNYYNHSNFIIPAFSPKGINIATSKNSKGWELEVAIPFSVFSSFFQNSPAKIGNEWKFQISRWDYQKTTSQFSSLTQTGQPSPHVFNKMPYMRFVKK